VVRLLVEEGAQTLYSALGIGLAVLGAAFVGAIPTRRSPPDPSTVGEEGEASEPLGGCVLAIFGVAVWSMTFSLLFVMAMPVVHEVMVGDRCDGAALETFCGIESIPVTIAVAFLLAIAVTVIVLRILPFATKIPGLENWLAWPRAICRVRWWRE
jgi:hypothetical protein